MQWVWRSTTIHCDALILGTPLAGAESGRSTSDTAARRCFQRRDEQRTHIVYVISEATGATGQRVVRAALAQFGNAKVAVELEPAIRLCQHGARAAETRLGELILRDWRWATVDVTNKSIEECVAEIIALQRRRVGNPG